MTVHALHQPRWAPDDHMVDAAMAGRVRGNDLPATDRAWLVAQLTHRGHTNDVIADWLHCSRRTIQMARTEPVAVLTTQLLAAEAAVAKAESRARRNDSTAMERQLLAERDQYRDARNRLIDDLAEMRRRADTPCEPSVIVVHPPRTRRRPGPGPATLPLF